MTDFKVGDKVKTTVNVLGWEKELPKGTVTTVTEVEPFQMAQVRIPCTDSTGICHFKELALIEPKLEIGDKVRVLIGSPLNESKGTIATVGCINSGTLVTCRTSTPYNINWVYSLDEIERVDMLKVGDTFAWQYDTACGNWKNLDGVFIITGIDSNYLRYTIGLLDGERKIAKDSDGVSEESIFYRMKPEDWARIDWPETEDKVEEVVKEVVTEQEPKLKFRVGDRVQTTAEFGARPEGSLGKVIEVKRTGQPHYKVKLHRNLEGLSEGTFWLTATQLERRVEGAKVKQKPERKFKIGDKVRTARDIAGEPKGAIGEIVEVDYSQMPYRVKFYDNYKDWHEQSLWLTETLLEPIAEDVEIEQKLERKFKVGDKVRLTEYTYGESAGSIGKVLEIKGGHMPYRVGFRLDAMCQYIGSLWLTETLLEPIASNFTVGQRVTVEGYNSWHGGDVNCDGIVGIVTGVNPIEDMVHIDCHNHHIMYFKAKFLRLAPGAEPVADPVEVCKKPKSLKKEVKAYHSDAKLCDSTKDSLLECFNSALRSLLDPNETSRGASEDIVRMIAYLTQLYTFYRGDAK